MNAADNELLSSSWHVIVDALHRPRVVHVFHDERSAMKFASANTHDRVEIHVTHHQRVPR